MAGPFDIVNSINAGKKIDYPEKDYNSFLINRAFSYFPDTILVANELNQRSKMNHDMQYSFYLNMIRPRKRFSKWAKTEKQISIEMVSEYYQCNYLRAKEICNVLTNEQLKIIEEKVNKGGKDE